MRMKALPVVASVTLALLAGQGLPANGAGEAGAARSAESAPAAPRPGRVLRIGVNDFPGNFNPNIENQGVKAYVNWMALRPVTAFDAGWDVTCLLCTEIPTRKNGRIVRVKGPDGSNRLAVRFTLKPDLKWGDGRPVTSRDVRFTWQLGRSMEAGFTLRETLETSILDIQVVDDRNFVVVRPDGVCDPARLHDFVPVPAHVEQPVAEADPSRYRVASRYETATTDPALWNGPYLVTRVEAGAAVVLDRNPQWTGHPPWFDRIVVQSIENSAALEQALLSGTIDYVSGEYGFSVHQASQVEKHHGYRFSTVWRSGLSYRHFDVNHDHPALKDVRVRRALLHAINRQLINDRLYYGRNTIAANETNPLDTIHDPDVRQYDFDPAESARLLDEAGWRVGPDGIRRNAAGEPLRFEVWAGAGDRSIDLELQIVKDSWRRIGVEADVKTTTTRVLFGEILPERRFNGLALFSWVSSPRESPHAVLHSSQIPTAENGMTGLNFLGYRDPEMDAALDALDADCGDQKAWSRVQRRYSEDLPALPIFFSATPFILPPWLQGVTPTGNVFDSSIGIEYWRREEVTATPPADATPDHGRGPSGP